MGTSVANSLSSPEIYVDKEYTNSLKKEAPRQDLPDFSKVLQQSNADKRLEIEKENQSGSLKDGELKIGESKNDKEFREMLEKITGKKQDKLKNKLEKDDYLNLMVTQLKYQDPTKPIENQEMATQLAQFNTVEQLMGINKLLMEMSQSQKTNNLEKYTSLLGKTVKLEGNTLNVSGNETYSFDLEIPYAAKNLRADIKDENEKIIRTISLENLSSGSHKVMWDGLDEKGLKVKDGIYTISADASSADGKAMNANIFILAEVKSVVDISTGGAIETQIGKVTLDKISSIHMNNDNKTSNKG